MDKNIILIFHDDQLKCYGGAKGIRDEHFLESALAQPQASFAGEYVHMDVFHMAAAYGFHLCQNYPFCDGNKRTGLTAMYTFLFVNGYKLIVDKKSLYAIMIDLASGKITKDELREFQKSQSISR